MLTITDIRYCGVFASVAKMCELSEGDSAMIMQDIAQNQEHLFIVCKADERQHIVTLEDKLALFNHAFTAAQLSSNVNDLGKRFRFYYR